MKRSNGASERRGIGKWPVLVLMRMKEALRRRRERHERAEAVDGWHGRERRHCCYDVYLMTNRCTR